MEALSIASAIVNFITICGDSAKGIRRIIHDATHAPDEIVALSNEVSEVTLIVSDIKATIDLASARQQVHEHQQIETAQGSSTATSGMGQTPIGAIQGERATILERLLTKAKRYIESLNDILNAVYLRSPTEDKPPKFARHIWVKKKQGAQRLINDFKALRLDLFGILGSMSVRQNLQTTYSITNLRAEVARVPSQTVDLLGTNNALRLRTAQALELTEIETIHQVPDSTASIVAARETEEALSSADKALSTVLQTSRQIGQFATLTLQLRRIIKCDGFCTCICHSRSSYTSPRLLNRIFGALFVGYAGLPIWTQACNVKTCSNQYSRAMEVSYSFPSWFFLQRTVDMVFAMTQTSEPHFALKVRNRIQEYGENNIFQLARAGQNDGIATLFTQHRGSPNDLSYNGGFTPIRFALELGRFDTVRFLIDQGTDPYFGNDRGENDVLDISGQLLGRSLRNVNNPQKRRELESIFHRLKAEHVEIWDFTFLHRVVVGELYVSLEETLQNPKHRADINAVDRKHRTPLVWAAYRGDEVAVKLLIQAGADSSIAGDGGDTPLLAAVTTGSVRCIELLVLSGANIHHRDNIGQTGVIIAAWTADDPKLMEPFILAGAPVNAVNCHNEPALQSAACLNHPKVGEYLISMGATIDWFDKNGDTPLFEALRYGNHEIFRLLLEKGANVTCVNKAGETILHLAAIYGTTPLVEELASFPMTRLDLGCRDKKGRTAEEIFAERVFKPDGLEEAMQRLFQAVRGEEQVVELQDEEDDEEFWDALDTVNTED